MALSVEVVWDYAALGRLSQPGGGFYVDMQRRGTRVQNRARQLVPVDQGTLRASIHVDLEMRGGEPVARIGSPLEYAIYVHEGTGIYGGGGMIRPKRGEFLRWPGKQQSGSGPRRYKAGKTSGYVFARQSKGSPGVPFLKNALPAGLT